MSARPWILVDFDGVLNIQVPGWRLEELARLGWRTGLARLDGHEAERVCFNPGHGQWLTTLAREAGARLAWATMREPVARSRCAPLAGLPEMPVIPVLSAMFHGGAATKAESVVRWTRGAPFAWFEDLADECEAADELAGSQPHLMVQVDPREGLTARDVQDARDWLASLGREHVPGGEPLR